MSGSGLIGDGMRRRVSVHHPSKRRGFALGGSLLYLLGRSSSASALLFQSNSHNFSSSSVRNMNPANQQADEPAATLLPIEESKFIQASYRQEVLQKCVPPLTSKSHKGSSGRIGILGGSARYTGAPYYAGMAALKVGADLAFVFCANEASLPIKSYTPELMVAPVYKAEEFDGIVKQKLLDSPQANELVENMVSEVEEMLEKLHAMVIGPGLGRCPLVMEATSRIIRLCMAQNIPLVIDADGLFLLTQSKYEGVLSSSACEDVNDESSKGVVVLTPNVMERKRLQGFEDKWDRDRVVIVEKGPVDRIILPSREQGGTSSAEHSCLEIGGLKRSGGIGDVLAGTLGTMVAWNSILEQQQALSGKDTASKLDEISLACWLACSIVKRSTHVAYHKHYRSMTAPDVLDAIGPTFHEMTTWNGQSKL